MKKPTEFPMMVTMYGVPPTMGPRDGDGTLPWTIPTPQPGTTPETPPGTPPGIDAALRRLAAQYQPQAEVAQSITRVADALAALRLSQEITRPDHRALLDLCVGNLRRAAEMLDGGK